MFDNGDSGEIKTMIIVTGGAGFIGSNIVKELNERGERDMVVREGMADHAE